MDHDMVSAKASHTAGRISEEFVRLDDFFMEAVTGTLFESGRAEANQHIRNRLRRELVNMLFHQRPLVEEIRGISTVYDAFDSHSGIFKAQASAGPGSPAGKEAMLFLGLLPFPGQWRWLDRLTREMPSHPEVTAFLENESRTILRKLAKKNIGKLKLRHFCQVLKAPDMPAEKGVLRIFSRPYIFYFCPELLDAVSKEYILYVEPAAGINFRHAWLRMFTRLRDPALLGIGGDEDRRFLNSQPRLETTPLAHGDFLEANVTEDEAVAPDGKAYDIVFNNTFDEMDRKRHCLMLDLMDHPRLKGVRVLFMGRGSEENVARFKAQVRAAGLESRCTVVANIMRRQVPGYLSRCRAGVHLALQENGCRAVYEYFRVGLPCVMSKITAGMNPDAVNPRTGIVAADDSLGDAVADVLGNLDAYDPDVWFREMSGSINCTRMLNDRLKEIFSGRGYRWEADIVELVSSGPGRYADTADRDRFAGVSADLEKRIVAPLKQRLAELTAG